jgi:hypothetical protein
VFDKSVLCLAIGQGLNVFSVWWIGSAKTKLASLSTGAVVGIYVGLVVGYGALSFIAGLLSICMAIIATESLGERITKNIERVDLSWS